MRILRMGAGEDGSGERSSTLFVTSRAGGREKYGGVAFDTLSHLELPALSFHRR